MLVWCIRYQYSVHAAFPPHMSHTCRRPASYCSTPHNLPTPTPACAVPQPAYLSLNLTLTTAEGYQESCRFNPHPCLVLHHALTRATALSSPCSCGTARGQAVSDPSLRCVWILSEGCHAADFDNQCNNKQCEVYCSVSRATPTCQTSHPKLQSSFCQTGSCRVLVMAGSQTSDWGCSTCLPCYELQQGLASNVAPSWLHPVCGQASIRLLSLATTAGDPPREPAMQQRRHTAHTLPTTMHSMASQQPYNKLFDEEALTSFTAVDSKLKAAKVVRVAAERPVWLQSQPLYEDNEVLRNGNDMRYPESPTVPCGNTGASFSDYASGLAPALAVGSQACPMGVCVACQA